MTLHRTITAIATELTPFGAQVEVDAPISTAEVFDPPRPKLTGIAKRPPDAGDANFYVPGQEMTILTEGGCIGFDGIWVEVRGGKVQR